MLTTLAYLLFTPVPMRARTWKLSGMAAVPLNRCRQKSSHTLGQTSIPPQILTQGTESALTSIAQVLLVIYETHLVVTPPNHQA